jgi:DNA sulfur modification protein DndB
VDINAQQRKVKQSLLQELYAELHWDADQPEVRMQAILSKVIQALDSDVNSPFRGRILKADDTRTESRCISLTSVFHAMERGGFFIERMRKGSIPEYGPLWDADNEAILKRTVTLLTGYFDYIRAEAANLWERGSGEGGGLAMNDGVTVCINTLRSIFHHLQTVKRIRLSDLENDELVEAIAPWAKTVSHYFASFTPEQMSQFRALRGVQGQTDYRAIILENWNLFEPSMARGKGSKDNKTKWIVEVNDLRKPVMHASRGQSLPITEEELALLEEIHGWLRDQVQERAVA